MHLQSLRGSKRCLEAGAAAFLLLSAIWLAWPGVAVALPRDKKAEEKHYGLIFGTVWNSKDQPVQGVRVKIRRASDKKARWEVYSNGVGEFEQLVPAGSYVVWADVKRPKTAKKGDHGNHWTPPQVTVQVDNDVRVDIGLHLTE
jgi:hypothetical protein